MSPAPPVVGLSAASSAGRGILIEPLEPRISLSGNAYPIGLAVKAPLPVAFNGELYLNATAGLSRTDGDAALPLSAVGPLAQSGFNWNGTLYFQTASAGLMRLEPGSTTPVEIKAGGTTRILNATSFTAGAGVLYFTANGNLHATDGTDAGTRSIRPGIPLGTLGSKLFFRVNAGGTSQLWVTDGTAGGTVLLKDQLTVFAAVEMNGYAYLSTPNDLWRSNGTAAGTTLVTSKTRGTQYLARVGNYIYTSEAITEGRFLFRSDGTDVGTVLIRDNVEPPGIAPTFAAVGNTLYFTAVSNSVAQIFSTSGTGPTRQVTSFTGVNGTGSVQVGLVAAGGQLFFPVYSTAGGYELWTSNGTPGDFRRVPVAQPPAAAYATVPQGLTAAGGSLYFTRAATSGNVSQLWRYGFAASALERDGTLVVTGTDPAESGGAGVDSIAITLSGLNVLVTVNGAAAQSFPAASVRRVTVNGLGGADALEVSDAVRNLLTSVRGGGLTYNAGSGVEQFSFRGGDTDDVVAVTADRVTVAPAADGSTTRVLFPRGVDDLFVQGGGGADTVTALGNPAPKLTIDADGGDDQVRVGAGRLDSVAGQVAIAGGAGDDVLTFDDSANATTGTWPSGGPPGATGDRYALRRGELVRTRVTDKGVQIFAFSGFHGGVSLLAGPSANVVTVAPDPSAPISVAAHDPAAVSPTRVGDVLVIDLDGASAPLFAPAGGGAGRYSFADRAAVTYTGVEAPDDLAPPRPPKATFAHTESPNRLSFRFDEPVLPTSLLAGLTLTNRTTGRAIPATVLPGAYTILNNTATFTFTGASQGLLPEGDYRAVLAKDAVKDLAGNPLANDFVYDFSVLTADANGDGRVDFADLVALAQNYDTVGPSYARGDFNRDGRVDFNDMVLLAQRYDTGGGSAATPVPPPAAPLAVPLPAPAPRPEDGGGATPLPKPSPAGPVVTPGVGIDTAFGVGGKVAKDLNLAPDAISFDHAADAARTPDGNIVVVGSSYTSGLADLIVAQFKPDGTLDRSFGTGGVARYRFLADTRAVAVHVYADGKILVAGTARENYGTSTWHPQVLLLKLNPDGSPDLTFGNDGARQVAGGGTAQSMEVLADGKILVGGRAGDRGWSAHAALWRFHADGSVDSAFGNAGRVTNDQKIYDQFMTVVAALPDGRALVVTNDGMIRLNTDGTHDLSFGGNNNGLTNPGIVTLLPDGKMLVANGNGATRLDAEGKWDQTYAAATNGIANFGFPKDFYASSAFLQADGKLLVGGTYYPANTTLASDFALVRLNADGTVDTGFGLGGRFYDPFGTTGGQDYLNRLVQLSPNRVVAVGVTRMHDPADNPNLNTWENVGLAAYRLDPGVEMQTGGPYAPVFEGSPIDLSAAGTTDPSAQIVKYEWDYGFNGVTFVPDATGLTAQVVAGDSQTVVIALRVTTSDGVQTIATTTVEVQNRPPTVDAGPPKRGVPGAAVTVRASATDAVSESFTFTIDWGDGTAPTVRTATGIKGVAASATHAYAARGTYTVTVTADDGDGGIATDTTTVQVGDLLATVYLDTDGDGSQGSSELSRVGHRVFLDVNQNGVADPGEPAEVTNEDGQALFSGLAPGVYAVRAEHLLDHQFSSPAGGVVDATVWSGAGATVSFGLTRRGSVSGSLYDDANGNARWDLGELPLAGRTVTLTAVGSANTQYSAVSNSLGMYRATGVLPGRYLLRATAPADWVQTDPGGGGTRLVSVDAAGLVAGVDFGLQQVAPGVVTGQVFIDADGDGVRGTDESAAADRTVFVDANGNGQFEITELSATTDASGDYTLRGLPAGTHEIRLAPRGGWDQTSPAGAHRVTLEFVPLVTTPPFATRKIDLAAPQAVGSFDAATRRISFQFSEPIVGLTGGDLTVVRLNPTASVAYALVAYDQTTGLATFAPQSGAAFPAGDYRARVPAGSVADLAGNVLAADVVLDFSIAPPSPEGPAAAAAARPVSAEASDAKAAGSSKPVFSTTAVAAAKPAPAKPRVVARPRAR
jgi:uncharacterized delta-60 repeat protein